MKNNLSRVLLATHLDPPIHGQSIVASQLVTCAEEWKNIDFFTLNTAYVNGREELGKSSIGKICKFLQYLYRAVKIIRKEKIDTVILTPAFFRGAFLKDGMMIRVLSRFTSAKIIAWVFQE